MFKLFGNMPAKHFKSESLCQLLHEWAHVNKSLLAASTQEFMEDDFYVVNLNIRPFLLKTENVLTLLNVVAEKNETSFSKLYLF